MIFQCPAHALGHSSKTERLSVVAHYFVHNVWNIRAWWRGYISIYFVLEATKEMVLKFGIRGLHKMWSPIHHLVHIVRYISESRFRLKLCPQKWAREVSVMEYFLPSSFIFTSPKALRHTIFNNTISATQSICYWDEKISLSGEWVCIGKEELWPVFRYFPNLHWRGWGISWKSALRISCNTASAWFRHVPDRSHVLLRKPVQFRVSLSFSLWDLRVSQLLLWWYYLLGRNAV
jgi:hypothetical protein